MKLLHCKLLLALTLVTTPFLASAGATDTLPNSRTLLVKGVALFEEGKYKEAMKYFRQVPEGDTNYALAVHEMANTCLADSAYKDAQRYAKEGLQLMGPKDKRSFLLMLGHALSYQKKLDEANSCYDSLIRLNPYDHQPWYEKGAMYMLQDRIDDALPCFHKAIMLNPVHFRSHFNLGIAMMKQGRMAESYLALGFCLFTTNDRSLAAKPMILMSGIQTGEDEATKYYSKRNQDAMDPEFDEANEILKARLALSKDYRFESVLLGDATINTMHALLEKLKYNPRDSNFVMQFYLPLYKNAFDNGQFDPMMIHMFSGYGVEKVDKLAKKNRSDVTDFQQELKAYLAKLSATQVLHYKQRQTAPEKYAYITDEGLFIVGGIKSLDPLKFTPGPIIIYNDGNLAGEGKANAAGEKDGEWVFYYNNGNVKSRENFRNGKVFGKCSYYRENGTLRKELTYGADGSVSESLEYTYSGILESKAEEKRTYADFTSYNLNGTVEYKAKLVRGEIQDPILVMKNQDGKVYQEAHFEKGRREGITKKYYADGTLADETEYHAGSPDGNSTTYYANGKVHYKLQYRDGKLNGPYEEYNEDGKLIERGEYKNGKKTGTVESLTAEGRVYGTITYKKDLPVSYRYTDENGKVLSDGDKSSDDGLKVVTAYYPDGVKMCEVPQERGGANGEAKYYYPTGALRRKVTYVDDKQEGMGLDYYRCGFLKSELNFHEDQGVGTYTGYSDAGKKRMVGYMENNERCGLWKFFYPDGTVETEAFYVAGKQNGPEKSYFGNGKLEEIRYFDMDMIVGLVEYDTLGNETHRTFWPQGNGTYENHFVNGSLSYSIQLRNGYLNGPYTTYFPDGSVREKGTMENGVATGEVQGWYANGALFMKGQSLRGKREGVWTWYGPDGKLDRQTTYKEGDREGHDKYFLDGQLLGDYMMHDDERYGRQMLYGDSEKVAVILIYKDDNLTGYTYLGKDGKEVPVIALPQGTGHLEAYYPNGQKSADFTYKGGVSSGTSVRWYSNGQKMQESTNGTGGNLDGPYRQWTRSGQLVYEATYKDDHLVGSERTWNTNGVLISSCEYADNGERNGIGMVFDPRSGKTTKLRYYHGYTVSTVQ